MAPPKSTVPKKCKMAPLQPCAKGQPADAVISILDSNSESYLPSPDTTLDSNNESAAVPAKRATRSSGKAFKPAVDNSILDNDKEPAKSKNKKKT
ncbi:hypothetical protein FRC07_010318, partial [Ceratobasidium sp. 392]